MPAHTFGRLMTTRATQRHAGNTSTNCLSPIVRIHEDAHSLTEKVSAVFQQGTSGSAEVIHLKGPQAYTWGPNDTSYEGKRSVVRRQDHLVDHVDHTIRCFNVSGGNRRAVDLGAAFKSDRDLFAVHGGSFHAFGQVGGHHFARDDVIGQDSNQLILVLRLQQVFNRSCRKRSKSGVGRREHGERAGALQSIDQTCGLNGSNQRFEVPSGNRSVDDDLIPANRTV